VDPDSKKCTVVLSDLGLAQILDSISSSTTTKSSSFQPVEFEKKEKKETSNQNTSKCGTLVYNSYETLLAGKQSQKSDGYSLGMSILALFFCEHPFVSLPIFREVIKKYMGDRINLEIMGVLMGLMEKNMCPKLSQSHLFKSLLTLEGGKFQPVHECLNEVFTGLTQLDVDKRMSVHKARKKVQSIKHLLPEIGEGFECPSIDDIIIEQKQKYFDSGTIIGGPMSREEVQESTIKSHDIIDDRDHDESEKESEEQSGRDMGHGTQSILSMSSKLQSTEKDNRDMPSYMLHKDERERGTSSGSHSIITLTDEYDSLSISSTKQSSIESRDYLESRGLDREKEE
ncbi:hypothetical protein ADUPG1_002346, partial [Aduncisulcus paluster]